MTDRELTPDLSDSAKTPRDTLPLLAASGIQKNFGGVQALKDGRLEVLPGEVHALLGENGAGKSTLVKIIGGALKRDQGTILWLGEPVAIGSLAEAASLGIRVIHQRLNVIDQLSVADNLTLGRENVRGILINQRALRLRAAKVLERLGVSIDLDTRAGDLSIAERQLIEVARALDGNPRLLVMDEPTASLGEREVERLFEVVRSLRNDGVGVVYISHKLDEVLEIADRVTVLRDGSWRGTLAAAGTTSAELVELMVGRGVGLAFTPRDEVAKGVRVQVSSLSTATGLWDISFDLHHGEVLGVYGLMGSGRTELARALFGLDPLTGGEIRVDGQVAHLSSPADAKRLGLGYVPEDRATALYALRTLRENLTTASSDLVSRRGWLNRGRESDLAWQMVRSLAIRPPSPEQIVGRLSGGNQQKAVLGRWLMRQSNVLILDDPTSGVDVGSKSEIYQIIRQLTDRGTSVLMSSSELSELMTISDRILVLHRGMVAGLLAGGERTERNVLHLAVRGVVDPGREDAADQRYGPTMQAQ